MSDQNDEFEQLRETVRDSLFLQATLRREGQRDIVARVRNLSSGGMMVETGERLKSDETIETEIRGVGPVAGRVAWVAEGRVGVAFDVEINPQLARKPVGIGKIEDAGRSKPKRMLRAR